MTDHPMPNGDFPDVADTLAKLPALLDRYESLIRRDRAINSEASADRQYPESPTGWELATTAWGAGADNLNAWRIIRLDARAQPHSAHYTLVRGALEGAVTTRWLVDPYQPAEERRRRAAVAQYEDYAERRKFEVAVGAPPFVPPAKSGAERESDFAKVLTERGIAADVTQFRSMAMTDRFSHYAMTSGYDGAWLYRVLSAYAHGMQWQSVAFGKIVELIDAPAGDGQIVKLAAREGPVNAVTVAALMALTRALAELEWFGGYADRPPPVRRRRFPRGRDPGR